MGSAEVLQAASAPRDPKSTYQPGCLVRAVVLNRASRVLCLRVATGVQVSGQDEDPFAEPAARRPIQVHSTAVKKAVKKAVADQGKVVER